MVARLSKSKPLLFQSHNKHGLTEHLKGLGMSLEIVGKPVIIEDLRSKIRENLDNIDNLSDESKKDIRKILDDLNADAGWIINKHEYEDEDHYQLSAYKCGEITIMPLRLTLL